jgi:hypothetical protein
MHSLYALLGVALIGVSVVGAKVNLLSTEIGERASGSYKFQARVLSRSEGQATVENTQTKEIIPVLVSPSVTLTGNTGTATITLRGSSRSLIKWSEIEAPAPLLGVVTAYQANFVMIGTAWYHLDVPPDSPRGSATVGRKAYGYEGVVLRFDP